jgi:two-component system, NarL family, invasion response regulator UvrY
MHPLETHILVVDDHAVVRRGLKNLLLASVPRARVAEAGTCAAMQELVHARPFDLLLVDLVLPDGNTIDMLPALIRQVPQLRVLMYSMSAEEVFGTRALQAGAYGFVTKAEEEEELMRAVRMVLRGKRYESPLQAGRHAVGAGNEDQDPFDRLSPREISTMDHLLRGRTVGEIAELLGVGNSTAATFKARLFNKLGVNNLLELQRKADLHGYRVS